MTTENTIPTFKVYIGDPCYAINGDADWSEFLKALWTAQEKTDFDGSFIFRDCYVFAHPTAHGDGCFAGTTRSFPVDSGLLGAIPLSLLSPDADLSAGTIREMTHLMMRTCYIREDDSGFHHVFKTTQGVYTITTEAIHQCPECGEEVSDEDELCYWCETDAHSDESEDA